MGLTDPFTNIAGLGPRSTIAGSDIIHIRSTGGVDSKMTIANLFDGIPVAVKLNSSLTVEGNTFLIDTTIDGNLTLLTTGTDGRNLGFVTSGQDTVFMDNIGGGLRLFNSTQVATVMKAMHRGALLVNTAVDNLTDNHQVEGSIYASTTIQAKNNVFVGDLLDVVTDISPTIITVGLGQTGDVTSQLNFVGDTTYPLYGLRVERVGGANGISHLLHRGTGRLEFQAVENTTISLRGVADYATFGFTEIQLLKPVTGDLNLDSDLIQTAGNVILVNGAVDDLTNVLNVLGDAKVSGVFTAGTFDSGNGATELYFMNQNVRTTDSVTLDNITYTGVLRGKYSVGNIFGGTEDKYFDAFELWGISVNDYVGGTGTLTHGTSKGFMLGVTKISASQYRLTFAPPTGGGNSIIVITQNNVTVMNMSFSGDLALS